MLYRATAIFIVFFWLTMTGLLLRNELRPGDSVLREVPFTHVVKLLFAHGVNSNLSIYQDKLRLGSLSIEPHTGPPAGTRVVTFKGNLLLAVPGSKRQRVGWRGNLEMEKTLAVRRFQLGVTFQEPLFLQSEITVIPAENVAHYEVSTATGIIERQDYTLDERGAREVIQQLGLDPALLQSAKVQQSVPARIKALQSSIEIHGERMATYLVTFEYGGQTLLEFHVDQLGKIVRGKTFLGHTFTQDD